MPNRPVTVRRWEVVLAFGLLTFAFVFSLWLVNREAQRRSDENRHLIENIQEARAAALQRVARTDIYTCQQIEKLKAGFRQDAAENYEHLKANAKLLGITVTPQLRVAAKKARDKTFRRYAQRKGGCSSLPSAKKERLPSE